MSSKLVAIQLIHLIPIRPKTYFTLLEHVPGISAGRLESFLKSEFKSLRHYNFPDDNGDIKDCYIEPHFNGHLSQSLQDDLQTGRLTAIDVIHPRVNDTDFDENPSLTEEARVIKLRATRDVFGDTAMRVIRDVVGKAHRDEYRTLRVKIKTQDGGDRSVDIDVEEANQGEVDTHYTKHQLCNFANPLQQCVVNLEDESNREILDRMQAAIREELDQAEG